jgi:hypothetical protein
MYTHIHMHAYTHTAHYSKNDTMSYKSLQSLVKDCVTTYLSKVEEAEKVKHPDANKKELTQHVVLVLPQFLPGMCVCMCVCTYVSKYVFCVYAYVIF